MSKMFDYHTIVFIAFTSLEQRQELLMWCLGTFGSVEENWDFDVKNLVAHAEVNEQYKGDIAVIEFKKASQKTLFDLRWTSEFHLFENENHAYTYHQRCRSAQVEEMSKKIRENQNKYFKGLQHNGKV